MLWTDEKYLILSLFKVKLTKKKICHHSSSYDLLKQKTLMKKRVAMLNELLNEFKEVKELNKLPCCWLMKKHVAPLNIATTTTICRKMVE